MLLVAYGDGYNPYRKTLRMKRYLFWTNIVSNCLMTYFFLRFEWYCEPYMHTLFALSEYVVVLSRMLFGLQLYHDFSCLYLNIDTISVGNI